MQWKSSTNFKYTAGANAQIWFYDNEQTMAKSETFWKLEAQIQYNANEDIPSESSRTEFIFVGTLIIQTWTIITILQTFHCQKYISQILQEPWKL